MVDSVYNWLQYSMQMQQFTLHSIAKSGRLTEYFLESASTVKQAEGVVCIECPVAKENDAHLLSFIVV